MSKLKRFGYIDGQHGQIHYWTAGDGPNLLLLHQSGNSSEEFSAVAPFLAKHYRMIAVDLPGHGNSYDPVKEPHVEDYAAAVKTVLDELNVEKTHIVGHHGGALSAIALLADDPDRFAKAILSGLDEEYTPEEKQFLIDRVINTDTSVRAEADFMGDAWGRYMDMRSAGASPALMLKPFISFLDARQRPFRGILTNLGYDKKEALTKLRGPVLLVNGELDSFVVKQERILAIIPEAEHFILPGASTFMFYDYAENCAEMVISYLQKS